VSDEQAAIRNHRLERWELQDVAKGLRPDSRMSLCRRRRIQRDTEIAVVRTLEGHTAYKGLMVCGLVWECPVCAALVTQKKRADLLQGISHWKAQGGFVLHLVLTIPHHATDDLGAVLNKLQKARRTMMNRKSFKRLFKELGIEGSVRSLEVTWGEEAGWHPHTHELLFCKDSEIRASNDELWCIGDRIFDLWQSACESAGLPKPNRRGVELQGGQDAASYAAKWGVAEELTKSHIKRGRKGRMSPWDLLREFRDTGDFSFARRWMEFADTFKRRHQLSWSKGLRELVGLGRAKTDEELARDESSQAVKLGTIEPLTWFLVLRARARGELLEVAREYGWQGVKVFLTELRECKRE
jgi:hypothetical protein